MINPCSGGIFPHQQRVLVSHFLELPTTNGRSLDAEAVDILLEARLERTWQHGKPLGGWWFMLLVVQKSQTTTWDGAKTL